VRVSNFVKISVGVLAGISMLTLVGPVVGETIATLPPAFPKGSSGPSELGLPFQDVTFPTDGGLTLRGWFIPAEQVDAPAIVYAPATRNDQRSGLSLVPALHRAGYHVLLFSYRGHALSDGRRWEFTYGDAESQDLDAAVRFLWETKGIYHVGVIGHSVGAASAIMSGARNDQIGAVAAVAPFNSVSEVWQTSRPLWVPSFILDWTMWVVEKSRGFHRDEIRPLDVVDQIAPRPLLLIHGTADQRITEDQVRRLYAAAGEPKSLWLVEGATHGGIRSPILDEMVQDVIAFFDNALRDREVYSPLVAGRPDGRSVAQQ
jgi:dipeptidyl aminopeptidase/acylaminoacyl peptidase